MSKTRINAPRISSITTDEESGTDSGSSSRRQSKINHHHIQTSSQYNDGKPKTRQLPNISNAKSSFSSGYRYCEPSTSTRLIDARSI